MKKYFSCLLVLLALLLPALGTEASAAETVASGTCGENLTWTLNDESTLTISGTGDMTNYDYYSDAPWYSRRKSILSIVVEDGVTSIGNNAFSDCSSLESITIPDSVTSIDNYAFYGCTSLESITIPASVTSIGNYAFEDCTSLVKVGITDIGAWCQIDFRNSYSNPLYYADNGLYLSGEPITNVVLPENVTLIPQYAFANCKNLSSITIPESVTSIDNYAFYGCTSLESITIQDSITSIGSGAFYGCTSLSSITIPDGVTSIGSFAFRNCTSLSSITIPDSVTSIGSYAFDDCSNLTDVYIADLAAWLNISFDGYNSYPLHANDLGKRIYLNGGLVTDLMIPDGVTTICDDAFYRCSSLESVTIPDSVTSIGAAAFMSCTSLKSITIPDSVTSIGASAFRSCTSLISITISDSITSIDGSTFSGCTSLESVTIPDSVTSIGYSAFSGCSGLKSVTIPDSVTTFEDYAFSGCTSLESIVIPGSVTSTGWYTFYNCRNLKSATFLDGFTYIGDCVFDGCSSLRSVTFPDSVSGIGDGAFNRCSSLTDVYITDIAAWLDISFNENGYFVRTGYANPLRANDLGKRLYLDGELITHLVIPEGVNEIGAYAFYRCSSLESVTIPDCVTEIGTSAFYSCSSLADVYYGGTEDQWSNLRNLPETNRIHYNCPSAENHWTTQTIPESCFEDGLSFDGCSCGYRRNETVIPAIGKHDHVPVVTPPTCTEDGYTTYTCTVCGDIYTDDPVTMLRHDMGDWFTTEEPTCTREGSKRKDCSRCDHFETEVIPSKGHSYTVTVISPTCTEDGYTTYTCTVCGDTYSVDPVSKLGHDMGEWTIAEEVTCTEDGSLRRDCSRCEHFETKTVTAKGHSYTTVITPPSCVKDGYVTYVCSGCGDTYGNSVEKLGHNMGQWTTEKEPECIEEGVSRRECTRCDYFETEAIEANGHVHTSVVTPPTCTEDGYTTYTCTVCGDTDTDDFVDALGHDMRDWIVVKEATFTESGLECRYCRNCDYFEVQDIEPDSACADLYLEGHVGETLMVEVTSSYSFEWMLTGENAENVSASLYSMSRIVTGNDAYYCMVYELVFSHPGQYVLSFVQGITGDTRYIAADISGEESVYDNPFQDVPEGSFYYEPVMWAVENGITQGTAAATFSPNDQCMRAQVVTFLWRAVGSPEPRQKDNPFVDVKPTDFYYKPVLWALENGITSGVDANHFAPTAYCNRAQVVTFLYRTLGSPAVDASQNPFTDVPADQWFSAPVLWAVENDITKGLSATTFGPNTICNRAQIVTFLYRTYVTE